MDILIKGMEMPTDDILRIEICPNGQVNRIVGWAISEKRNAIAIALTKHGRCIDADRLLKEQRELSKEVRMLSAVVPTGAIENAPTVLEASD